MEFLCPYWNKECHRGRRQLRAPGAMGSNTWIIINPRIWRMVAHIYWDITESEVLLEVLYHPCFNLLTTSIRMRQWCNIGLSALLKFIRPKSNGARVWTQVAWLLTILEIAFLDLILSELSRRFRGFRHRVWAFLRHPRYHPLSEDALGLPVCSRAIPLTLDNFASSMADIQIYHCP